MQETTRETITIELNGADVTVAAGSSIGDMLDERDIERRMIAIEYNGEILPRHEYDETVLQEGDRLEIVHMVGGG